MNLASICIVQLGRIGDFILTTPMFRAIKSAYPSAEVSVLIAPINIPIAHAHPDIDNVLVYEKSLAGTVRTILQLRGARFEYWIDPKDHTSIESRVFVRLARAVHTVGFNTPGKRRLFKTDIAADTQQRAMHAVDRNMRSLDVLDLSHGERRPSLTTDSGADSRFASWRVDHAISDYTCVNISAGTLWRMWPEGRWSEFFAATTSRGERFVIIASARDRAIATRLAVGSHNVELYPTASILDACSAVQSAKCVVSPDTSIIHVAGAFDIPVVGLYPDLADNLSKFHPLSTRQRILLAKRVGDIPVDDVVSAYFEMMGTG